MAKRYIENDIFTACSSVDFTDKGKADDRRFSQHKKEADTANTKSSRAHDFKSFLPFKSTLPFKDEPCQSFSDFESEKAQIHNTQENKHTRASD